VEGWELTNVAGERMEEANGGVLVPLKEKEAVDRVKGSVIPEQWKPHTDKDSRVEVEEADIPTQLGR
jgi:hypothetical protein